MTTVPFAVFCPTCKGHRTFTLLPRAPGRVGCCVCGTSEREALVALSERVSDDRDSMGELAARLNTLDGELAELRDEVHDIGEWRHAMSAAHADTEKRVLLRAKALRLRQL